MSHKPFLARQNPICPFGIAILLVFPSACGVPAENDVVYEIMEATGGIIGKVVPLKLSKTFAATSLDDAQRSLLGLNWQVGEASLCKAIAPKTWPNVRAYDFPSAMIDAKGDKTYHLRICAAQVSDPKAIVAIGLVVSSQKILPDKPN